MSKTGYIYKICCHDENVSDFYIGSTKNIKERKRRHREACNNVNGRDYNLKVYKHIRYNGGFENWDMIVVKQIQYNKKHELRKSEREVFDELKPSLNSRKMSDLSIELCGNFKEYKKQTGIQYRLENAETLKMKKNKKTDCNCGGKYTESHKASHLKTKKHQIYLKNHHM